MRAALLISASLILLTTGGCGESGGSERDGRPAAEPAVDNLLADNSLAVDDVTNLDVDIAGPADPSPPATNESVGEGGITFED